MNNTNITEVTSHKHLGVFLSSTGHWHEHVNYLISKISPKLNILRKSKFSLGRYSLQTMYFILFRSILDYGDIVWDCLTKAQCELLENLQLEAARIVTGGTKLTSRVKLHTETGWLPLEERRKHHKLILFHKMVHGLAPQYLLDLLPHRNRTFHHHDTRTGNDFRPPVCRTTFYNKSFFPSVIHIWNSLPVHVKNNPSINTLKTHLSKHTHIVPSFYLNGTRLGQIHHARLRMECSSLKFYLFQKNLIDSPICSCLQSNETNEHFLLHCRLFSHLRLRIFSEINHPLSVELLLFGSTNLTEDKNSLVFSCVQNFIIKSKRFELWSITVVILEKLNDCCQTWYGS